MREILRRIHNKTGGLNIYYTSIGMVNGAMLGYLIDASTNFSELGLSGAICGLIAGGMGYAGLTYGTSGPHLKPDYPSKDLGKLEKKLKK